MQQSDRSGVIAFKPRARLLKLIGSELISDEVLAITELVKNAHDADASSVVIEFRSVTSGEGEIVVRDDGTGMDLDTVLHRWMEPAGSSRVGQDRRITPRGRRALGEKGVGRFAADKLAAHLELFSRSPGQADEVCASFDWDQFDDDTTYLSSVTNRWELRRAEELPSNGTVLHMRGLRSRWNERMFRRLCTRLLRLRSPFRDRDDFRIHIESDEFPDYSGELRSEFLDRAPYRIEAIFDGKQSIEMRIGEGRWTSEVFNGAGGLNCGPIRVRIFGFDLETEAIARIGPRVDVRAWLREWSGISVYRDGFRVWPYGEPHDDWLRLDQRRVNNPTVKLSNNQVVGFVEITRDGNPDLTDQTNREGLINNRALDDLRRFVGLALQALEGERQILRHPVEKKHASERERRNVSDNSFAQELESLSRRASGDLRNDLRRFSTRITETIRESQARSQALVDGYAELAAVGQSAVVTAAAVRPSLDELNSALADLQKNRAGTDVTVRRLKVGIKRLEERLALFLSSEFDGRRRRRAVDLFAELGRAQRVLQPALESAGITMELDFRGGPHILRADIRPEVLHLTIQSLTTNSIEWLRNTRSPKIRIRVREVGDYCEILFNDNGPGISGQHANRVFEPFFSLKENGRGMGLTILRDALARSGASIGVDLDGRRLGATFRIMVTAKRSRATMHT
jgi:signal transduction histidine kinase